MNMMMSLLEKKNTEELKALKERAKKIISCPDQF